MLIVAEVIRRLVTDTLEKTRIEIWPFMWLLGAKLVILGSTDFLFGLPINFIVNAGQNKFEVDILKNVAKIANLRPKIGQIPLLSLDINWHSSIIFHSILTFFFEIACFYETNRMVSKSKLYLFWLIYWCLALFFAPRPHMGKIVCMNPKPP